jgi:hypothetical protein
MLQLLCVVIFYVTITVCFYFLCYNYYVLLFYMLQLLCVVIFYATITMCFYFLRYNYYVLLFSILQLLCVVIFSLLLNIVIVKLSVTTVNAHIDARLSAEHHSLSVYI